jgi:hypothetical protein
VHHGVVALGVHHRTAPHPADQVGRIARLEHIMERVAFLWPLAALELRKQVQVVIAEHRDRPRSKLAHEAQHLERFRTAVHQVADEPQPVGAGEPDLAQQQLQLVEAPLHIADRVRRHRR